MNSKQCSEKTLTNPRLRHRYSWCRHSTAANAVAVAPSSKLYLMEPEGFK